MSNYQYINGRSYPRIIIKDFYYNTIETFNLPLCDENGLIETNIPRYKSSRNIFNRNKTIIIGWHKKFTLSYANLIQLDTLIDIKTLLQYFMNENYYCFLYPRSENTNYYFDVNFVNSEIIIGLLKGGLNSPGNKGVILEFQTRYELTDLRWENPNQTNIWLESIITKNQSILNI